MKTKIYNMKVRGHIQYAWKGTTFGLNQKNVYKYRFKVHLDTTVTAHAQTNFASLESLLIKAHRPRFGSPVPLTSQS